ncbi:MAG: hypothetical protein GX968_02025 [Tissierellia bacterium]|nr:hypothetical protein [Tissierellia bacterium]
MNGHSIGDIHKAVKKSKNNIDKPSIIILDTIKGKDVSFAQDAGVLSHSMTIDENMKQAALKELDNRVNNL